MPVPKFNILHGQDNGRNCQCFAHNSISPSHITHLGFTSSGALNQRYLQLSVFVPMVITPQAPLPHIMSVGALGDVSKSDTMS